MMSTQDDSDSESIANLHESILQLCDDVDTNSEIQDDSEFTYDDFQIDPDWETKDSNCLSGNTDFQPRNKFVHTNLDCISENESFDKVESSDNAADDPSRAQTPEKTVIIDSEANDETIGQSSSHLVTLDNISGDESDKADTNVHSLSPIKSLPSTLPGNNEIETSHLLNANRNKTFQFHSTPDGLSKKNLHTFDFKRKRCELQNGDTFTNTEHILKENGESANDLLEYDDDDSLPGQSFEELLSELTSLCSDASDADVSFQSDITQPVKSNVTEQQISKIKIDDIMSKTFDDDVKENSLEDYSSNSDTQTPGRFSTIDHTCILDNDNFDDDFEFNGEDYLGLNDFICRSDVDSSPGTYKSHASSSEQGDIENSDGSIDVNETVVHANDINNTTIVAQNLETPKKLNVTSVLSKSPAHASEKEVIDAFVFPSTTDEEGFSDDAFLSTDDVKSMSKSPLVTQSSENLLTEDVKCSVDFTSEDSGNRTLCSDKASSEEETDDLDLTAPDKNQEQLNEDLQSPLANNQVDNNIQPESSDIAPSSSIIDENGNIIMLSADDAQNIESQILQKPESLINEKLESSVSEKKDSEDSDAPMLPKSKFKPSSVPTKPDIPSFEEEKQLLVNENELVRTVKKKWSTDGIHSPEVNLTFSTVWKNTTDHIPYLGKTVVSPLIANMCGSNSSDNMPNAKKIKLENGRPASPTIRTEDILKDLKNQIRKIYLDRKRGCGEIVQEECIAKHALGENHKYMSNKISYQQRCERIELQQRMLYMPAMLEYQMMQLAQEHQSQIAEFNCFRKVELMQLNQKFKEKMTDLNEKCQHKAVQLESLIKQVQDQSKDGMSSQQSLYTTVDLKKGPCRTNNHRVSYISVCLPADVANVIIQEDEIYDSFYTY